MSTRLGGGHPRAPGRWLDEGGGATPGERDLLRSGLAMDPPPDAQAKVWAAILAGLPAAGAVSASSAAGGKVAAAAKAAVAAKAAGAGVSGSTGAVVAGAGVLKSALIGAGCGLLVLATYSVVAPSAPELPPAVAPAREPVLAPPRGPMTRVAPPDPTVAASVEAPPEPRANEPRAPAPPGDARATMLAEESRLVGEAQDALRGGDAAGALVLLDRIAARFPGGGLGQEREALSIEALYRSGRRPEASTRAAAFLKAYPSSTLATRVEAFAR